MECLGGFRAGARQILGEIEWVERLGGGEVWTESNIRKVPRKGVEGLEILEGCVQKARKVSVFIKKKISLDKRE